jgi:hypothetical protein
MSAPLGTNARFKTVENILGQMKTTVSSATSSFSNSIGSPETGNYILNVFFYFLLFAFILFLILTVIHFTVKPIFRFNPGDKGYIGVPANRHDKVYWNEKEVQPGPEERVPLDSDKESLIAYKYENNYSFSVDLYCTRVEGSDAKTRLILFKTYKFGESSLSELGSLKAGTDSDLAKVCAAAQTTTPDTDIEIDQKKGIFKRKSPLSAAPSQNEDLQTYMKTKCSLMMYLTETNDLIVSIFTGGTPNVYNSRPIKNIPLYQPFRVTVVVEEKNFTVYLNAKQASQTLTNKREEISLNTYTRLDTTTQRFYTAPTWANQPKTIYARNFHLWPRAILYEEVRDAQPPLASVKDFGIDDETVANGESCSP